MTHSPLTQGRPPRLVAALALIFALAHVPFLATSLEDIDSVNFALGLRHFDVAQHRPCLRGEARLDHHEVPAQVDDVVDVLDRDGALANAGAARHAVPDDVVGHRAGDESGRFASPQDHGPLLEEPV